jgi:molybdopterin biosynthesis enzyme
MTENFSMPTCEMRNAKCEMRIADCGLRMEYSGVISEEEARAKILSAVAPLPATEVSLGDALDRFAATDLFATIPLPPFDNSAMDGYAVVAGSTGRNARLKIVGAHSDRG